MALATRKQIPVIPSMLFARLKHIKLFPNYLCLKKPSYKESGEIQNILKLLLDLKVRSSDYLIEKISKGVKNAVVWVQSQTY